jgi:hypothetical protein
MKEWIFDWLKERGSEGKNLGKREMAKVKTEGIMENETSTVKVILMFKG